MRPCSCGSRLFSTAVRGPERAERGPDLLAQEVFDLVLLDNIMPGMSGIEFLAALKQREIGIPVILMTGQSSADIDVVLNAMAIMRLMRPNWVIPAVSALNICQPNLGYRRGLRAGANLVTMNLTPAMWRENYVLYKRDRFIMDEERILKSIEAEGLRPSTVGLAEHWQSRSRSKQAALA